MTTALCTPTELQNALLAAGRSVSLRKLIDWRAKDFLPPLKQKGRGRCVGALYHWSEPDIFRRATLVFDTIQQKRRDKYVYWVLWFSGFQLPPKRFREAALYRLKAQRIKRVPEPGELQSDKFSDDIERLAKQIAKSGEFAEAFARPFATEFMVARYEQAITERDEFEFQDLVEALQHFLSMKSNIREAKEVAAEAIPAELVTKLQTLLRSLVSIQSLTLELRASKDDHLRQAQAHLCQIGNLALKLVSLAHQPDAVAKFDQIGEGIGHVFGPILFRVLLRFIRVGYGPEIVATLNLINCALESYGLPSESTSPQMGTEFAEIWKDFSLPRIYNCPSFGSTNSWTEHPQS